MSDGPVLHQAHVRYSAEAYDRFTAYSTKPFDVALAALVTPRALKRMPGAVIVDIGTGTGRFLIHLAGIEALAGARLVGTDLFDDMLAQAGAAAREAGVALELTRQDVHRMDFPDAMADIVTSRSTVHHWHDPARAFREIFRILKPGGIAFICDIRRDAPAAAVDEFNRLRAAAGLPPSVLDEKYTVAELEQFCRAADLEAHARFFTTDQGLFALGVTVTIEKP